MRHYWKLGNVTAPNKKNEIKKKTVIVKKVIEHKIEIVDCAALALLSTRA